MLVARACRPRELACPKRAAVRYCVGKAHIDGPRPQLTDIVANSLQIHCRLRRRFVRIVYQDYTLKKRAGGSCPSGE
eukprot:5522589-Pyramimonas_sp.AAC.1